MKEDSPTRSVKQRVERESTMELDQQQAAVLDALEFGLTLADSDTASITGGSEVSQRIVQDSSGEQSDDHNVREMAFCLSGGPHARGSAFEGILSC